MATEKEYKEAERERRARERGRTIPHYAGKVARKLTSPPTRGQATPSKRASK